MCSGSRHFHDLVDIQGPGLSGLSSRDCRPSCGVPLPLRWLPGPLARARAGAPTGQEAGKTTRSPPWPLTLYGGPHVLPNCIPSTTLVATCWIRFAQRARTASSLSWKSSVTPMHSNGRSPSRHWMARGSSPPAGRAGRRAIRQPGRGAHPAAGFCRDVGIGPAFLLQGAGAVPVRSAGAVPVRSAGAVR